MASKRTKIWTLSSSSLAGFQVSERQAFMIANPGNFIVADPRGVAIVGRSISLAVSSENIRTGGFFVKQNDFVQMVPTSLVTPMPNNVPYPPLGLATSLMRDVPFFLSMLK